jgi:hypothetical protein
MGRELELRPKGPRLPSWFSELFAEEPGVRRDESRYRVEGASKATRLRFFLKTAALLRRLAASPSNDS